MTISDIVVKLIEFIEEELAGNWLETKVKKVVDDIPSQEFTKAKLVLVPNSIETWKLKTTREQSCTMHNLMFGSFLAIFNHIFKLSQFSTYYLRPATK